MRFNLYFIQKFRAFIDTLIFYIVSIEDKPEEPDAISQLRGTSCHLDNEYDSELKILPIPVVEEANKLVRS